MLPGFFFSQSLCLGQVFGLLTLGMIVLTILTKTFIHILSLLGGIKSSTIPRIQAG